MTEPSEALKAVHLILVGTDPASGLGGISTALGGYREILSSRRIGFSIIPSHHPAAPLRQFWPAMKALPGIALVKKRCRQSGVRPILWLHVGAWPSLVRKAIIAAFFRRDRTPVIFHLHGIEVFFYLGNFWGRTLVRLCLRGADLVAVPTPWWLDALGRSGVPSDKMVVLPNPLSPALGIDHIEPAFSAKSGVVAVMSRLVEGKGVEKVIAALRFLPSSVSLEIAGDGPLKKGLERAAMEAGLHDRVIFHGWVDAEGRARLLRKAEVFCLPSRMDSFGMVFLEAMAFGVPVVALRWGPVPDVVPDGSCGRLADSDDPQELAALIEEVMKKGKGYFSENCRKWVRERFAPEFLLTRIVNMVRRAENAT
jgi:glycosyltransferase involved in cell wall biosynthesis